MFGFYKKHIEFLTEHAVDPDKRRYATKHEAVRHYIDLDQWGTYPFEDVPREWSSALFQYADWYSINAASDTILIFNRQHNPYQIDSLALSQLFKDQVLPNYYDEDWPMPCDSVQALAKGAIPADCDRIYIKDHFSEHGILPFNLEAYLARLTQAFELGDLKRILRYSADLGHYVGDAHVPLHTTKNYNGQLTDQVGIHGFWESRIPELYADQEYDFFVGQATYIDEPSDFFWDIVLTSHSYVDSVLMVEKRLSQTFPEDQQYCYEDRLQRTIRTQCEVYARAYSDALKGQVESRMRLSVLNLGSVWYTAWINAGQPDLDEINLGEPVVDEEAQKKLEKAVQAGEVFGREHGGR